ncbi:MAG: hypothetical protein FWG51_00240, partial [Firmicutes bacterium]|nr:hypothetical protein [Bacillota bacterium]
DGTTVNKNTPVKIKDDGTVFTAVSAGNEHSLAIDSDGGLWAFGQNSYGQLGDGTVKGKNTPIKIKDGTVFTDISAGYAYSLAIDSDGGAWAFGRNDVGQLGDGTFEWEMTPVKIKDGTVFTVVRAGWYCSLAIDSDGGLWTFGQNGYGQLGDGTNVDKNTPVKIKDDGTAFTAVSAGYLHSLVIDAEGGLWAFGNNQYGQLGDGTTWSEDALRVNIVPLLQNCKVSFNVTDSNGTLTAKAGNNEIKTEETVREGVSIVFTAEPNDGYRIKEWRLNGEVIEGYTSKTYTLANLSADSVVTVEFIEKENPAYTVPSDLTAVYGDNLSSVILPEGFTWESEGLVGSEGANIFYATFTPDDTENYNIITGIEITVMVKSDVKEPVEPPTTAGPTTPSGGQDNEFILILTAAIAGSAIVLIVYAILNRKSKKVKIKNKKV